jgi:hypothetical protein
MASELLERGRYAEAADVLERLAEAAPASTGRAEGPILIQAGEARILAGQTQSGVALALRGLDSLAATGRVLRLERVGRRLAAFFRERSLPEAAAEVERRLAARDTTSPSKAPAPAPIIRPTLPTHCPSCGAVLRSDEVEWLDDATAECSFCGSPVRGSTQSISPSP